MTRPERAAPHWLDRGAGQLARRIRDVRHGVSPRQLPLLRAAADRVNQGAAGEVQHTIAGPAGRRHLPRVHAPEVPKNPQCDPEHHRHHRGGYGARRRELQRGDGTLLGLRDLKILVGGAAKVGMGSESRDSCCRYTATERTCWCFRKLYGTSIRAGWTSERL